MAKAGIKVYYILLAVNAETLKDNGYKTKDNGVMATLKLLNKTGYNELMLSQEDKICFQIIE